MPRVIIIGAGLAGTTTARELRAKLPEAEVVLVTQDDGHVYPKPQLSTSLRTGKQPEQLISARAADLEAQGITVVARAAAAKLDPATREVTLADGRVLAYDDLVLAVGASPWAPPMAGTGSALTINHLDDYRVFRERLAPGAPVLVVGGGLIGIELAADMAHQGHPVHVVEPGDRPLPRLLSPGAGQLLERALGAAGVNFYWGRTVARLDGGPGEFTATLSDGQTIAAGLALSAVGLRPRVALAEAAGLPVGRGILVDAHLQAAPHVYAIGDCAELPGGVYLPFIRPIGEQARYVVRRLAGEAPEPFEVPNYAIAVKVPAWAIASTTPLPTEAGAWREELTDTGSLSFLEDASGTLLRVVATGDRAAELRAWLPRVPRLDRGMYAASAGQPPPPRP